MSPENPIIKELKNFKTEDIRKIRTQVVITIMSVASAYFHGLGYRRFIRRTVEEALNERGVKLPK